MFRKLNKKTAAILAATMCLSSFASITAFAASPTVKVTADKTVIDPGDEIIFSLTPDISYTAGFGTTMDWDTSSIVDYVDSISQTAIDSGWLINSFSDSDESVIRIGSIGGTLTKGSVIGTVTIDTAANIPAGTYNLPMSYSYMTDSAGGLDEAADPLYGDTITFTVTGSTDVENPSDPTDKPTVTNAPTTDAPISSDPTDEPDATEAPAVTEEPKETEIPVSETKGITISGRGPTEGQVFYIVVQDEDKNFIDNVGGMCDTVGGIKLSFPSGTVMNANHRITAHVYDATGETEIPNNNMSPIKGISVTFQVTGGTPEVDVTDSYGRAVAPRIAVDTTDGDGDASVVKDKYEYDVNVGGDKDPVEGATVTVDKDGNVTVTLPTGTDIDYDDRIPVTVTTPDGEIVEGIEVTVTDKDGNEITDTTDENGQITVPPLNIDITDENGKAEVQNPSTGKVENVKITDENGAIEDAKVEIDDNGHVTITLPDGTVIDPANRLDVEITDEDGKPLSDVDVTIEDKDNNIINQDTDENGKIVSPDPDSDVTDKDGKGTVTFTDEDGNEVTYQTTLTDEDGAIAGAQIKMEDGVLTVILPDEKVLDSDKPVTLVVKDKDGNTVDAVNVVIKDTQTTPVSATGTTKDGSVTLPVKKTSSSTTRHSSGGSSSSSSTTTYVVSVLDNNGKTVSVTKKIASNGDLTLTLPSSVNLKEFDGYYRIYVKDSKGSLLSDINVTLTDKSGNTLTGTTDKNGLLIVPSSEHEPYLFGYEDGEFKPENNITNAESAAIFSRLASKRLDEKVPSKKSTFKDVSSKHWATSEIAYLQSNDVIDDSETEFKPDEYITRAEFVEMAVNYYKLDRTLSRSKGTTTFTDISKSNCEQYDDIIAAVDMGWIEGYYNNVFRPDDFVTRAEAIAIINRIDERVPDKSYINTNMTKINPYADMKSSSDWYFYDIMEASCSHMYVTSSDAETWVN